MEKNKMFEIIENLNDTDDTVELQKKLKEINLEIVELKKQKDFISDKLNKIYYKNLYSI